MGQRPIRAVVALVVSGLLAACSSSTGASSTSTTSSTSSTSSTLPAGAVSIVKAPVLVAHTTDGVVGYRVVGAGPPLVLIMGYSGSMDAWQPSFVDVLARAHRVVIFDNAGIGRTTALPAPLTISEMADQTAALIEALHLGRPDVLGWSMGGMIAQALAVLHPALVRRLVLCATLPGNGKATAPSAAAARSLTHPSGNAILGSLFPGNQHAAERAYVDGIIEYPHFYLPDAAVDTLQLATLGPWLGGKTAAGRLIAAISAPTLVADGLDDFLVPAANDTELHAVIHGSQLRLYPDAGHAFLFQDERQFVPALERFLGN
ncbi:MAG: alpha/beta hydrolase [Acidimicrobiales bacterium]